MNFLFVHQFFPGQYLHLVRHLQEAGDTVIFVHRFPQGLCGF
jgi:hypothetical protein